jgi:hypothetical protein
MRCQKKGNQVERENPNLIAPRDRSLGSNLSSGRDVWPPLLDGI